MEKGRYFVRKNRKIEKIKKIRNIRNLGNIREIRQIRNLICWIIKIYEVKVWEERYSLE